MVTLFMHKHGRPKEHHQATSRKCLEISLENLHVDTRLRGLKFILTLEV